MCVDALRIKMVKIDDVVIDDLTKKSAKVLKVWSDQYGNVGIQIDNDYLEGLRHPWEITVKEDE